MQKKIAPGRFELPSTGPEPVMLGHYTTGLPNAIVMVFLTLCFAHAHHAKSYETIGQEKEQSHCKRIGIILATH